MTIFRDRVPQPPSSFSGGLKTWAQAVTDALNGLPTFSLFSGTDPGSSQVSGMPGHIAINYGSASTQSRVWVHGGAGNSYTTTEWVVLRTLA